MRIRIRMRNFFCILAIPGCRHLHIYYFRMVLIFLPDSHLCSKSKVPFYCKIRKPDCSLRLEKYLMNELILLHLHLSTFQ